MSIWTESRRSSSASRWTMWFQYDASVSGLLLRQRLQTDSGVCVSGARTGRTQPFRANKHRHWPSQDAANHQRPEHGCPLSSLCDDLPDIRPGGWWFAITAIRPLISTAVRAAGVLPRAKRRRRAARIAAEVLPRGIKFELDRPDLSTRVGRPTLLWIVFFPSVFSWCFLVLRGAVREPDAASGGHFGCSSERVFFPRFFGVLDNEG